MSLTELHGPPRAADAVRHALGLGSCPLSDSRFEILRATVWSMAAPASKAHVNRVLGAALPTWQFLSERAAGTETLRAELREALSTLEDSGDLIELSGGYWAPAPTRFVELPDGLGHLLVGGVPSALLGLSAGTMQFHGPHRHFVTLPTDSVAALPVESLQAWARLPENSLQDWAQETIDSLERYPYSPQRDDSFEFYLPGNSKAGAPQFFRWVESAGDITATLLARRRRVYGAKEYRLVDVRSGRIVSACDLNNVDVRRLLYSFDLAANNPVRARALRAGRNTEWLFTSELPRAEQRTFAAFGRLSIPDERRFERRWTFVRNEELALSMLRSLGIALVQRS
jgi:hypothetical protein